jgi:hypothetical protein
VMITATQESTATLLSPKSSNHHHSHLQPLETTPSITESTYYTNQPP